VQIKMLGDFSIVKKCRKMPINNLRTKELNG